ncbi:MAG: type I-G CRISPR-associated protein Csb2 [Thermoplasmata archaeon]
MLTIGIEFITGRYHANPWGRNVNESEVEWPPSPYRIVRALYDVCERKMPELEEPIISGIIEKLSAELPVFELPDAKTFTYGVYLSENSKDSSRKQLVFDSFIAVSPGSLVKVGWESAALDESEKVYLQEILKRVGYLGRSESLVRMTLLDGTTFSKNAYPADWNSTESEDMEIITVATPVSKKDYESMGRTDWIDALMDNITINSGKRRSSRTSRGRGFVNPPALKFSKYSRRRDCFNPHRKIGQADFRSNINAILFALDSTVLPMIEDTVLISDRIHKKLVGIYSKKYGEGSVSERFTGKDKDGNPLKGHRHIYIIPLDIDNDQRLDHVLVMIREAFSLEELGVLSYLNSLWQAGGKPDIKILPVEMGSKSQLSAFPSSKSFRSETPFIPPRHYRKGRGDYSEWLAEELKRDAKNHGLPEPVSVRIMNRLKKRGRSISWLDFRRSRKHEPENSGYGFEVQFAEPVKGVFTLGYGSHYGLGLFVPVNGKDENGR